MNPSNNSSKTNLVPKWLSLSFLLVSILGFVDASYLAVKYYQNEAPPCSILQGCDVVTTSEYAAIFGISVALFGALYYFVHLALSVTYLDKQNPRGLKWAFLFSPAGFIASLYFIYLQLFVLSAICVYCMVSAGTSAALFLLGMVGLKKLKSGKVKS